MNDKQKAALGVGLGLGAAGIIYAVAKAKGAPEGLAAGIEIEVFDAQGNPIHTNSPRSIKEGEVIYVYIKVTNLTTKGGQAWEAVLTTDISALVTDGYATEYLIEPHTKEELFAGGQQISYNFVILAPIGTGGWSGGIVVSVYDPFGNLLAAKEDPITVTSEVLIYGASVAIT